MGGDLNLFVLPLRGAVAARDQAHAVEATEVAEHEGIASLRVVGRSFGEPEVPGGVLIPAVRFEKRVLLGRPSPHDEFDPLQKPNDVGAAYRADTEVIDRGGQHE